METDLSGHKRYKKTLQPPLSQLNLTPSSWINDRLPDMLWAVLAIGFWSREKALAFFRYVAKFVENNPECYLITFAGIGGLSVGKRLKLIKYMLSWSDDTKEMLRPLMFFQTLPGFSEWKKLLDDAVPEKDWKRLGDAVLKVLWHQSEAATDCRWVKILCRMVGGKMKLDISMKDTARGIIEYPNYGDLRKIRPSIRATEITFESQKRNIDYSWPQNFWKTCFEKTICSPESLAYKEKLDAKTWETSRRHYLEETRRLRMSLIDHFLQTSVTTAIDARYEACFGFAFYSFTLFTEITLYKLNYSVVGRMILRSLVECLISFAYLLKEDDPDLWKNYRGYGTGQAKLIYLKLQELKDKSVSINEKMINEIANEDVWQEFVSINIGQWDKTDLRKMSEKAGLKDIYDQYYNWTSGYIHASWAAIRETVYERCFNPLHRLHRLPTRDFAKLLSVTLDALKIVNDIYELLSKAYPVFEDRIKPYNSNMKRNEIPKELLKIYKQFDNCKRCKQENNPLLHILGGGRFKNPQFLFLFINPTHLNISSHKDYKGKRRYPFIGVHHFYRFLSEVGFIDRKIVDDIYKHGWQVEDEDRIEKSLYNSSIYITNLVKCTQPHPKVPNKRIIEEDFNLFKQELNTVSPRYIITFGILPFKILTGKDIRLKDYLAKIRKNTYKPVESIDVFSRRYNILSCYFSVGRGDQQKAKEMLSYIKGKYSK